MRDSRKLALWLSAGASVFVLATAIITRNPGLYLLAAISAGSAIMIRQQTRRS